jgi:hypothetical protein
MVWQPNAQTSERLGSAPSCTAKRLDMRDGALDALTAAGSVRSRCGCGSPLQGDAHSVRTRQQDWQPERCANQSPPRQHPITEADAIATWHDVANRRLR